MTLDKLSDEDLMMRVQKADHDAFSELVRRHTDRFYACAQRICADPGTSEDIVQDAFLKLWSRPEIWKQGKGAKFTTWFYRVVTNMALDYLRKKKPVLSDELLGYAADDKAPRQDDVIILSEEEQALEGAIDGLPERQKLALNLCFYEELSNKEAADILEIGVKALESLLMRAKAGLKDELMRQGLIEPDLETGSKKYG
jgi:RNA polymerase sigma-70 factor (ECF subfamily)